MLILFLITQFLFIFYLNRLRLKGNSKLSINKIALFSSLLTYIITVASTSYLNLKYQSELDAFDLNKDGLFSGNEINEEQQKAMRKVISDTGRNFAPFTGILISMIYYIILLLTLSLINKMSKNYSINN
ncbi:hypothetical protein [Flavobacterium solisilvae]|jgi:hypothetical protein|uniref:EF-hand domain-containing protein n=1 Tax=Flavobacterium solisilvae TaxID=1852019 RepID=A0ABX1QXE1_9FLAO|nr:hypothetical protein [Flavobacterium solisilvae]NMH26155.1 hypothetical protein [Flavobacterium solisilvae]